MEIRYSKKSFVEKSRDRLLAFRSIPNSFVNFIIIAEIGQLIIFSDSLANSFLVEHGSFLTKSWFMVVEILVILVLQLTLDISLFRMTYLKYYFQFNTSPSSILIVVLATITLVIDILKTATTLTIFHNKWSERYNYLKLLGYLINITSVMTMPYDIKMISLVLTLLFLGEYIIRLRWRMVDDQTQILLETMCICGFSVAIFNLIRTYYSKFSLYYDIIILAFLLFLNYLVHRKLQWRVSFPDMGELQKQHVFLGIISEIVKHLLSYKKQESGKLREFLTKGTGEQLPQLNSESEPQYFNALYNFALPHKTKCEYNSYYLTLLAQLQIKSNNIVKALKTISELERLKKSQRSRVFSFQIWRLKQFLRFAVENYKQKNKRDYAAEEMLKGYFQNYYFIEKVSHATEGYASLWAGFIDGYNGAQSLNNKLDQLFVLSANVNKNYEEIVFKSKHSSWMYLHYLMLVSNEFKYVKSVRMDFECLRSKLEFYKNSIFMELSVDGKILQIGQNVGLLGFQREQLEGKQFNTLVPEFYRHLLTLNFTEPQQNKFIVCIDSSYNLKKCELLLDIYIRNNEIYVMGNLRVLPSKIIAFKATGEILQTGCHLSSIVEDDNFSIDEVINSLLQKGVVNLSLFMNQSVQKCQFSLVEVIENQQKIYLIETSQEDPKNMITLNPLGEKEEVQPENNLLKLSEEFRKKSRFFISFLRIIGLIILPLSMLALTLCLSKTNEKEQQTSKQITEILRIVETSSLTTVSIMGKAFHVRLGISTGVMYPTMLEQSIFSLMYLIISAREAFPFLATLPQALLHEQIRTQTFQTKALLILQTIVEVYDWMITDLTNYGQLRFFGTLDYIVTNTQTVLFDLLPLYQQQVLTEATDTGVHFKHLYQIQLVLQIVLVFLNIFVTSLISCCYSFQASKVTNSILAIQSRDVVERVKKVETYRSLLRSTQESNEEIEQQNMIPNSIISIAEKTMGTSFIPSGANTIKELISEPLQIKINEPFQKTQYETNKKMTIRDKSVFKKHYGLYIVLFLISIGTVVNSSLYLTFVREAKHSIINYTNSLLSIKSIFYSFQVMYSTLILNFNAGNTKMDIVHSAMQSFTKSTNNLQKYDAAIFSGSDFDEFRQMKANIDYIPICQYMTCKSYFNDFNVTYYASIAYSYQLVDNIYKAVKTDNITAVDLINYQMDYLIAADRLYMDIINHTMELAFKGIQARINSNGQNEQNRVMIQYGIVVLLVLTACYSVWEYLAIRRRIINTLNLFNVGE